MRLLVIQKKEISMINMEKKDWEKAHKLVDLMIFSIYLVWVAAADNNNNRGKLNLLLTKLK